MTALYETNNQQISAAKGIRPLRLEDAAAAAAAVAVGEERRGSSRSLPACRRGVWF